jgi:glycine oxidase
LETDYIILGAGIAGCTLALELDSRGYRVILIDEHNPLSSSQVAAGLMNPIVPKRVIPAWNANEMYPKIEKYYADFAPKLGATFYASMPMLQFHASEQERHFWQKQSQIAENKMFIEFDVHNPLQGMQAPFGCTLVHLCGRLDVQGFCAEVKLYFEKKAQLISEKFNYDSLHQNKGQQEYKGYLTKNMVFCEGTGIANNPFFHQLPATQTWGDILRIRCKDLMAQKYLLKQKHWIAPIVDDEYFAGSNFLMDLGSAESQFQDINEIIEKLRAWIPEFEVIEVKRAARPTVLDRRPFMGMHSQHHGIYIYNGLGTRGCSLVTWLSPLFADFLEGKTTLSAEFDVNRFYSNAKYNLFQH